jgi:hypothetical protein
MITSKVMDVPAYKRVSVLEMEGGCACIVTRGQNEFHACQSAVSLRMDQTSEAGAAMVVAGAWIVRIAEERGTMGVVRPCGGGQVGGGEAMVF